MATSLLQSRFAGRLLLLFVGCALVPMAILAVLALTHTSAQLERQSRERLHQGSKSVGLAILERLVLLEAETRVVAERFARGALDEGAREDTAARLRALARVSAVGDLQLLLGDAPPSLPQLDRDPEAQLAAGGSVLLTPRAADGSTAILLVTAARDGSGARLVAELDPDHVLGPAAVHTEGVGPEYCLLLADGRPLACSFSDPEDPDSLPADLGAAARSGTSGDLEWARDGSEYLAYHWSLFLKARFASPPWRIVLMEPRSLVVGPMATFKRFFVLVFVGSILCVALLATSQIRRSLVPLQRLRAGTRRIAQREFDVRVDVTSGDEIEELADAFNGMAETLGRQFSALLTIDEIDRAILSSVDPGEIVETILTRLGDVHDCDALSFALLDADGSGRGTCRVRDVRTGEIAEPVAIALDEAERERLRGRPDRFELDATGDLPRHLEPLGRHLEPLARSGAQRIQVLPVRVGEQVRGVVGIGHRDGREAQDPSYARQIADQAAVALANADMVSEIRDLNRNLEAKVADRTARLSAALDELRETQARLVHREKMASIGQLVAGVAHELNNPLNFLKGNLPFLRENFATFEKAIADYEALAGAAAAADAAGIRERHDLDFVLEDLGSILDACDEGIARSTAIVADLQSFSRLDSSECREVDLREALESTRSILANRLAEIEVVTEYDEIPPVECLASQVDQVLMNLIVNAADAVGGSGRIVLRTLVPEPGRVRVEVQDDGCGIEPAVRDRIFDPFFTTKGVGEGTGLGLAITFGVVSRHSGRIDVESRPGEGACFRVELPVKFEPPESDEPEEAGPPLDRPPGAVPA